MTISKQEKIIAFEDAVRKLEKDEEKDINAKKIKFTLGKVAAAVGLGMGAGAAVGTVIPGVGTAVGTVVGGGAAILVFYMYGHYKNKKLDKLKAAVEAACEEVVHIVIRDHDGLIAVFGPQGLADRMMEAIRKVENEPQFERGRVNDIVQNLEEDARKIENLSEAKQKDSVAPKTDRNLNVSRISSQHLEREENAECKEIKGFDSLSQAPSSYSNDFVFFSPAQSENEMLRGLLVQNDEKHMQDDEKPVSVFDSDFECDSHNLR